MDKKFIINKFGGGILKKDFIPMIAKRIKEQIKSGYSPVIVVSAMPGITDSLVYFLNLLREQNPVIQESEVLITKYIDEQKRIHEKIMNEMGFKNDSLQNLQVNLNSLFENLEADLKEFSSTNTQNLEDKIVSYGEKLSATILSAYFNTFEIPAKRIMAEEIPIITDDNFKNANIDYDISEKNVIQKISKLKEIPVIAGFTGITKSRMTTTLGRGGTDTTACFIGASLRASKIILWKDVGGVLSADPKIVSEAKTIPFINYQEAEEAGKIIHDKAIQYAKLHGTTMEIASIINPKLKTGVGKTKNEKKGAKIVSFKKNLMFYLITDEAIKGSELLAIASEIFVKHKMDVILISNTRYSLQIVSENDNSASKKIFEELKAKTYKVESYPVSMVYLVGNFDVKYVNDFNSLLIKLKTDLEISAFLYKNCTRLEAIIRNEKVESVVRALYKKFIK